MNDDDETKHNDKELEDRENFDNDNDDAYVDIKETENSTKKLKEELNNDGENVVDNEIYNNDSDDNSCNPLF
eukprot:11916995-Ditylum_brightwellii.AAC.1